MLVTAILGAVKTALSTIVGVILALVVAVKKLVVGLVRGPIRAIARSAWWVFTLSPRLAWASVKMVVRLFVPRSKGSHA